ncbi:hypothetical protein MiSe_30420 [Microseira wollei NIES-4236]|uniref:Uncharacterized protein n=1 Tax=Microseira wollei NIES-4236 TaxID=2530354 RepID=A0AAV3XA82_9CYAN|nr:hypothetical protein MiSe_30420 [Microseira wollei NIES-4236]
MRSRQLGYAYPIFVSRAVGGRERECVGCAYRECVPALAYRSPSADSVILRKHTYTTLLFFSLTTYLYGVGKSICTHRIKNTSVITLKILVFYR